MNLLIIISHAKWLRAVLSKVLKVPPVWNLLTVVLQGGLDWKVGTERDEDLGETDSWAETNH